MRRSPWLPLVAALLACSNQKAAPKPADPEATPGPSGSGAGAAKARPPRPAPPAAPLATLAKDPGGDTGKASWGVGFGGLGMDAANGLALAADGAVYVTGYFDGDGVFGATKAKAAGGTDAFLVRVDQGKVTWAKTWGAGRDDTARAVAVRGNTIVVVGNFLDELTLGEFKHKAAGSDDLFVAAFDPKGEVQWLWTSGGVDSDGANAVAATPDGGWIVGGSFTGEAKFGDETLASRGGTDALLIKLAPTGEVEWLKQYGGRYNDTITSLAVDPAGGIYALGTFRDVAEFGGKPLTAVGNAGNDIVVAKYDPTGAHQWSKGFGTQLDDYAGAITVDPAGNPTVIGSFERTIAFGPGEEHTSLGNLDVFVVHLDTAGAVKWSRSFGGDREDLGAGIAADAAGNVVAVGWFQGKVDFGKGVVESRGNKDGFVVKLDATGATRWARTLGDHDHDKAKAVAIDGDGAALVLGAFRFTLDAVTPALESTRADGDRIPNPDTFVLRLER